MALTKAVASVDTWHTVAVNTIMEGSTVDLSACYQVTLHIDAMLGSETATTNGIGIKIEISSATSGDQNWGDLTSFTMLAGKTGVKDQILNTVAAGTSVLSVSTLSGLTTEGALVGIGNLSALSTAVSNAGSVEIGIIRSQSATGITFVDGTTYEHASGSTSVIGAIGGNSVETISVNIPDTANRVRIVYDNTQDAAGSPMFVRANLSKVTAI